VPARPIGKSSLNVGKTFESVECKTQNGARREV
jgi:hypothetical protein